MGLRRAAASPPLPAAQDEDGRPCHVTPVRVESQEVAGPGGPQADRSWLPVHPDLRPSDVSGHVTVDRPQPEEDPPDGLASAGGARGVREHRGFTMQTPIIVAESWLYVVIAALLALAAGATVVDTISGVVRGADDRGGLELGLFILERTLLLFMIAEVLATLRIADFGARILAQPFLLIGMIAAVRRMLVVTAEFESGGTRHVLEDFLLELAGLGGLVLALAVAVWLLRAQRT
jgi:hypothetical protein